jgi:hypothetical protein
VLFQRRLANRFVSTRSQPARSVNPRPGYQHILSCAENMEGIQLAVEFRNKIWFTEDRRERVLAFLREHQLVHVVVDEPQGFPSSVPPVWGVTSPKLAIVRFHGRNKGLGKRKDWHRRPSGLIISTPKRNFAIWPRTSKSSPRTQKKRTRCLTTATAITVSGTRSISSVCCRPPKPIPKKLQQHLGAGSFARI